MARSRANTTLTELAGVRVGHSEGPDRRTGVTAILFDDATPTVVDVRGGASCTYDIASLSLESTFGRRWAIFFAGGSVFGLDAARGVRRAVLETRGGHSAFGNPNRVAPISGSTLFDLPSEARPIPDYAPLGHAAALAATREPVAEGAYGAGAGATIGKYLGRERSVPGGVGSSSHRLRGGPSLGALVVLNAVGAVRDPADGRWVAGARGPGGRVVPPNVDRGPERRAGPVPRGTSLVAVVTDSVVPRRVLQRVAIGAHTGLSRAVIPVHTATDGDVVFASSLPGGPAPGAERYPGAHADRLAMLAAELVVEAVLRAARATGSPRGRRRGPD
jgi:L-aminopeptidase/D-esterase-like protein